MGTHPIFESDFDCLTEWKQSRRRSRRVSGFKQQRKGAKSSKKSAMRNEQRWPPSSKKLKKEDKKSHLNGMLISRQKKDMPSLAMKKLKEDERFKCEFVEKKFSMM